MKTKRIYPDDPADYTCVLIKPKQQPPRSKRWSYSWRYYGPLRTWPAGSWYNEKGKKK